MRLRVGVVELVQRDDGVDRVVDRRTLHRQGAGRLRRDGVRCLNGVQRDLAPIQDGVGLGRVDRLVFGAGDRDAANQTSQSANRRPFGPVEDRSQRARLERPPLVRGRGNDVRPAVAVGVGRRDAHAVARLAIECLETALEVAATAEHLNVRAAAHTGARQDLRDAVAG